MKLPYIKVEVEYREEETGAPGKVSPALIVGFGLHWAWVYLFMFNGQYILFTEAHEQHGRSHAARHAGKHEERGSQGPYRDHVPRHA